MGLSTHIVLVFGTRRDGPEEGIQREALRGRLRGVASEGGEEQEDGVEAWMGAPEATLGTLPRLSELGEQERVEDGKVREKLGCGDAPHCVDEAALAEVEGAFEESRVGLHARIPEPPSLGGEALDGDHERLQLGLKLGLGLGLGLG